MICVTRVIRVLYRGVLCCERHTAPYMQLQLALRASLN
jgi:hypothetical protein